MGFLSGLASPLLTATSQAVAGQQQGDIQGLIEKRKLDAAEAAANLKAQIGSLSMKNMESEIDNRDRPSESFHFDQDGNPWKFNPKSGKLEPASISAPANGAPPPTATQAPSPAPLDIEGSPAGAQPPVAAGPKFGPKKDPSTVPGTPEWQAAEIEKAKIGNQYGYHPAPSFTPVVTTAPDGTQKVSAFGTKSGTVTDTGANAKAGAGGNMSGQTLMAMQRLGFTKNDLDQSIQQMEDFENNPANLARMSTTLQTLGATSEVRPNAEAHGLLGVLNNAGGTLLSATAQKAIKDDFPEFAQYLYNRQRVGTAFTEVLPRPNQQLLGIEKGLSGIDVNWTPALIKDIQSRRRGGQEMLDKLLSTTPIGQAINKTLAAPATQRATTGASDPGGDITLGTDPTARMSDADAWEYWKSTGLTPAQATAKVQSRKK